MNGQIIKEKATCECCDRDCRVATSSGMVPGYYRYIEFDGVEAKFCKDCAKRKRII